MIEHATSRIVLDVRTTVRDPAAELDELRSTLTGSPRRIPSRFLYDATGSALFERITELPEYYLTRAERALLEGIAGEIVARAGACELVELGSGAATKTRILLDAMRRAGTLRRYVPFDVSEPIVRRVAEELAEEYPTLEVHGVVGDFGRDLGTIPDGSDRLVIFLGSTIGNLTPAESVSFLRRIAASMSPGDHFLLGVDLVKDPAMIEAAYNDSAGLSAAFNRNILAVVNALTGSDFDAAAFAHHAAFEPARSRVEIRLVAMRAHGVTLPALNLRLELAEGESILTEISTKYTRRDADAMLAAAGLEPQAWFEDPAGLFALSLSRR